MSDKAGAASSSRVLTQAVATDWQQAYALAADPARWPEWASGLAQGRVRPDPSSQGEWLADPPADPPANAPGEPLRLRFVPRNAFGVLDHWVTPAGQAEVYSPFRVIATGPGHCEFQFTLLRQPAMDDAAFEQDSAWVARDLRALRALLEKPALG